MAGINIKTEILAGITTFLTSMYIIVVNPSILQNAGMPFDGVLTATVVVSAFTSIMMGIYAKNPIVLAPGMGMNAFFAFTVVQGMGVSWQIALGCVFWAGVLFFLLSVFNIGEQILLAIPKQLRYGIAAGIGLFITLIGFKNAGFIVDHPETLVGRSPLNALTITFLIGLMLTAIFVVKRVKGALVLGIVLTTLMAFPIGRWWGASETANSAPLVQWQGFLAMPDFSLFLQLDILGSFQLIMLPAVFTILFTDLFDSVSTLVGVMEAGDLRDEKGDPRNIKQSLIVDATGTALSGLLGTSPTTSFIESATGIEEGGRTGMTAIVAGLLFLPFMFLAPLLSMVPAIATAPALVLVGAFMMRPILNIHWNQLDDAIPVFLCMILIPLTLSITQGLIWGFLSWMLIKLALGKREDLSPMLYVICGLALLTFVLE